MEPTEPPLDPPLTCYFSCWGVLEDLNLSPVGVQWSTQDLSSLGVQEHLVYVLEIQHMVKAKYAVLRLLC